MKHEENPELLIPVIKDSVIKSMLVEHTGEKFQPDNGEVTIEMVIEAMAEEFPEILLAIAEENFIRGYQQGLNDNNLENKSKK